MILLSVIIPAYNRADALVKTLDCLNRQQIKADWEAIVVNNNCTDNTDDIVKDQTKAAQVPLHLVHEKKPGAAAARNAGARIAKGEFLVFIDNDILVEPDFLKRHLDALRENPNCWIVGAIANLPEQENSPFGLFRKSLSKNDDSQEIREVLINFTGANSSMPRADFEKLGGFDENFHVASGEDQELAIRARKEIGIKILYVPQIIGVHNDWAGWTFADFCLRQQLYARTEYFFWQKYGDEHPRLQMVLESLPISWRKDSLSLKIRKLRKRFLGNNITQGILLKASILLEKIPVLRPILWQFYKLRLAGSINNGLIEGREHFLTNT